MPTQESLSKLWNTYSAHVFVVSIGVTALGMFSLGYYVGDHIEIVKQEQRLNSSEYTFINPLLDHSEFSYSNLLTREILDTKEKINDLTQQRIDEGVITNASVYARDLNNGPWFIAGTDQEFRPASLLKVPLMMAFFKQAETDPAILDRVVTYTEAFTHIPPVEIKGSETKITVGTSYTVYELIERMIMYSDNAAAQLLYENIPRSSIHNVFTDLGIKDVSSAVPGSNSIGAREYASFLRILYNSTYLNRLYSEKALEIMSRTTYTDSIRSILPNNTIASTKYGATYDAEDRKGLHECGIIYWTNHPYILCVMTAGDEYTEMATYIAEVAAILQEAVIAPQ